MREPSDRREKTYMCLFAPSRLAFRVDSVFQGSRAAVVCVSMSHMRRLIREQAVARRLNGLRRWFASPPPTLLNRAIHLDKGVIFVAIPKNGTTGVRQQLQQPGVEFNPHPHLSIVQIRDSLYAWVLRSAMGGHGNFPSADTPTDADIRARTRALFSSLFKFAAVRNPWARAASLYARPWVSKEMSFDEFIEHHCNASDACVHPTLHRNQLDWLTDENGTMLMDYVYKLEEFERAVNEIAVRTEGRLLLKNIRINSNRHSAADRYRELYTNRTRTLIARRFERDIETFEYHF